MAKKRPAEVGGRKPEKLILRGAISELHRVLRRFFWPQKNAKNAKQGNFIFAFFVFFRGYGLGCGLAALQCHLPESLPGATIL
jgi:hypothetical protein